MYDIIIIGAGPAGLTAAIYACRAEKSTLVLEAKSYGGQIINTPDIANYPVAPGISGFEFATTLYNQAKDLGAQIVFEKAVAVEDGETKTVRTPNNAYEGKAVILATGAENRKLGVDALYLADLANTVYLIHRRDSFRADAALVSKLKAKENVQFVLNSNVTKLVAEMRLQAVEVTDKFTGEVKTLPVQGLFVAVGQVPENENFKTLVELDAGGYAVAGENCRTKTPGIFVAGDNRTKDVRQLVTAASDGAVAATEAIKYLNN